jgi:hypothetical protein
VFACHQTPTQLVHGKIAWRSRGAPSRTKDTPDAESEGYLGEAGRLQDCVMSGRSNCAPLAAPDKP